jgi:hypothetical protein
MKYVRHSPSALNLFCASPSMFVLEKILGQRQPVGSPAHRGTAVEEGITLGLMNPDASAEDCVEAAYKKYDTITALSGDRRREDYRGTIAAMVESGLAELRPFGVPSHTQGFVEWKPEGLQYPIVGYFDYHWEDSNRTTDLKTTQTLPSSVKIPHARQVALYVTSNNADPMVTYVTPKKHVTYRVDDIDAHRSALFQIALRVEKFLSLSDDPEFYTSIIAPDYESFYWGGPARQIGFDLWKF